MFKKGGSHNVVAVATHAEAASTLLKLIPVMVFHGVATCLAMVSFGLSQRVKKPARQTA